MWNRMFKQWMDLAFWWVPKGDRTPVPDEKAVAPTRAVQPVASAPDPTPERVADDLTVIKGIGPAVQKKLQGLNIIAFSDLAAADPDALTEKLKGSQPISVAKVNAWIESAREHSRK